LTQIAGKTTRLDYQVIEDHIEPGARVLDVGCGDGALLEHLIAEKGAQVRGIDLDVEAVRRCIGRGVPVYHGDMVEGMAMFGDGCFDCVVLSQTLQQVSRPARVVQEMLRVGRRAIISFPNFGHWRVRLQLLLGGRMPVTAQLPHTWHQTPNIHMLTVMDFRNFCDEQGLKVIDEVFLSPAGGRLPACMANLLAATAIFVVQRAAEGD